MSESEPSLELDLIQALQVPSDFSERGDRDYDTQKWNEDVQIILKKLEGKQLRDPLSVASVSQLIGPEVWLARETQELAQVLLASVNPSIELVKSILEDYVKPVFLANPHPQVNLTTGRALPRIAGGPLASMDHFQEQKWKTHPGVANVVSWCIKHIPESSYEQVWHLLIPPLITYIDDYQTPYKLRGALLVSDLLENVPMNILKRTGISQLLFTSLTKAYTSLHDELSPKLLKTTTPVLIHLITKTTDPDSEQRFEQLCAVLGENIIGSVWVFAGQERDTIEASMDVLPLLVRSLGIGSVRYLKALINQCIHCITLNELVPRAPALEKASLRALPVIIQECHPRMTSWKGTIIEGVGKYWVSLVDRQEKEKDDEELRKLVAEVFVSLSKACSSVLNEEYLAVLRVEPDILKQVISC